MVSVAECIAWLEDVVGITGEVCRGNLDHPRLQDVTRGEHLLHVPYEVLQLLGGSHAGEWGRL